MAGKVRTLIAIARGVAEDLGDRAVCVRCGQEVESIDLDSFAYRLMQAASEAEASIGPAGGDVPDVAVGVRPKRGHLRGKGN